MLLCIVVINRTFRCNVILCNCNRKQMTEADDRSAKGLLEIIKKTLGSYGISLHDGLVSNTFDGASVMSGAKGLYKTLGNT